MQLTHFTSLAAFVMLLIVPTVTGQQPDRKEPGKGARNQMAKAMQARFDRASPEIGALLPDVSGYRSDGTEISLKSLRGKHTVLVFGCLT